MPHVITATKQFITFLIQKDKAQKSHITNLIECPQDELEQQLDDSSDDKLERYSRTRASPKLNTLLSSLLPPDLFEVVLPDSSASPSPPPRRLRGSFTRSLVMKSATSGDKSSGIGGFVLSILLLLARKVVMSCFKS
ncbi:Protein of unknown function [Gryllus bimaculatus]|nr:Protein of unknown function [Gryllus bimaculatus]